MLLDVPVTRKKLSLSIADRPLVSLKAAQFMAAAGQFSKIKGFNPIFRVTKGYDCCYSHQPLPHPARQPQSQRPQSFSGGL